MSYSCEISFKTVNSEDVYSFLHQVKTSIVENLKSIAEDNFLWVPSIRYNHIYKDVAEHIVDEVDVKWAESSLFKFRYFYLPEHKLLGVFGIPKQIQQLFDNTTYFQNSCDQDYEFTEWEGCPCFEPIVEKWKNSSATEVYNRYVDEYGKLNEDEKISVNYYRRSFAYDEIWSMFSQYLFEDSACIYFSCFGFYESYKLSAFIKTCKIFYEDFYKECEEKTKTLVTD